MENSPLLTLEQAKSLVIYLESNDIDAANKLITSAHDQANKDEQVFEKVGELTRELHDALINFHSDTRMFDLADQEMPDARDKLNYVIEMTDKAANTTMDAVDACFPIADKLIEDLDAIKPNWQGLMTRDLPLADFKDLCHQVDAMLALSSTNAVQLRASLTDILMAQDFQDLTGQMIKRVITLVQEIETKLVGILTICQSKKETPTSTTTEKIQPSNIEAEGPIVNAEHRDDVVNDQDDVDDLLSSLGF